MGWKERGSRKDCGCWLNKGWFEKEKVIKYVKGLDESREDIGREMVNVEG